MDFIQKQKHIANVDRVLVFTDEHDTSASGRNYNPATAVRSAPAGRNYIINVSSDQNGVNSKEWFTITGMSEAVIDFIQEVETASW